MYPTMNSILLNFRVRTFLLHSYSQLLFLLIIRRRRTLSLEEEEEDDNKATCTIFQSCYTYLFLRQFFDASLYWIILIRYLISNFLQWHCFTIATHHFQFFNRSWLMNNILYHIQYTYTTRHALQIVIKTQEIGVN